MLRRVVLLLLLCCASCCCRRLCLPPCLCLSLSVSDSLSWVKASLRFSLTSANACFSLQAEAAGEQRERRSAWQQARLSSERSCSRLR